MTLDFIQRSWPSLFETDVRKVSERDCENWLIRFQQQYAPTVVNNSIGTGTRWGLTTRGKWVYVRS